MTRREVEEKIREKWGFLPYAGGALLLFEMNQEVPDNIVEYELTTNPFRPSTNFMVCSPEIAKVLNEVNQNKDE
tara:strand:- start:536 stop:757 length:222 start_codon:yes stop_codon:yes gene_type:complete